MFICEECIKDYYIDVPKEILEVLRSYGPCEDCHSTTSCYNVQHGKYMHKNSPTAKVLRTKGELKNRKTWGEVYKG